MSQQNRDRAIEIVAAGITLGLFHAARHRNIANYIINQLLKEGFLSDKVVVDATEVQDELDKAVFKCKVEE
jgi:hypothetical protein